MHRYARVTVRGEQKDETGLIAGQRRAAACPPGKNSSGRRPGDATLLARRVKPCDSLFGGVSHARSA